MKKILNIFASISLISTGAGSVVACGSHHNPNPPGPKSEIQKLYNQLNNKTFTIDNDNNFWGNEANYQTDLLNDLEKKANITNPKDKNLLSLNSDLKTLDQPGNYTFDVNIDTREIEKTALVTIHWKLTDAQSIPSLFDFYTKTWPQEVHDSEQDDGISISKLFFKTWPQDNKSTISWSKFIQDWLSQNFFSKNKPLIPNNLQKYFHIQPNVGFDSLNVNQYKQLKNPFYFQKRAGGPKIYLPYYDYSQYAPQQTLPVAIENWTVGYNTDYNLLNNQLKNIGSMDLSKTEFGYDPSGAHKGHYYVDNTNKFQNTHYHNEHMILNALKGSGYSEIIPNLTLKGELIPGQKIPNKPKGSPIEVYYNGVDQNFPVYVYIT